MIITIDGPVATGKSTIAKMLAQQIGYIYFDTGAMYRALTYGILKNNIDANNLDELKKYLSTFECEIKVKHGARQYFVNGEDVTDKIRQQDVTSNVSRISAIPLVREKLVEQQRQLAVGVNAVFEGRDMGTVVFPNANLKIFLTGRDDIRAKRRFDELKAKYPKESENLTLEQAHQDLIARDKYDSERETSPLKKANDALEVDTSDMTLDEVVYKILELKDTVKIRQKEVK